MPLDFQSPTFGTAHNGCKWPSLQDLKNQPGVNFAAIDPNGRCMGTSNSLAALQPYLDLGAHLAIVENNQARFFKNEGTRIF